MDKEQLERVNRALAPWMPARRMHRHLVTALIGLGMIPFLRPDMAHGVPAPGLVGAAVHLAPGQGHCCRLVPPV